MVRGWECWRVLIIGVYLHFATLSQFRAFLTREKKSQFQACVQLAPLQNYSLRLIRKASFH